MCCSDPEQMRADESCVCIQGLAARDPWRMSAGPPKSLTYGVNYCPDPKPFDFHASKLPQLVDHPGQG